MSGHSKWATIKRKKGKNDAEKGKVFTKISKEIFVAVRTGGGPDPDNNFRLKLIIQKAKANNMPNDNIQRSIQKAAGNSEANAFENLVYEGYGPAGVAVLCDILTDNRNRTASEIRYIFSRNGGSLGETGCVNWMFDRKGRMIINMEDRDEDEMMMLALEAGADDFSSDGEEGEIITSPDALEAVRNAFVEAGIEPISAEIAMIPQNTVAITDVGQAQTMLRLIEALEDNDDVQDVYSNFDIPDEIMEQLD